MKDTAEDLETRALRRSLRARRPLAVAARAVVSLAGWVCFVGILVALLAENHPALERWVAQVVRDRVAGALTRSVQVDDVDFRWLDRSVAFRGIALGPTGRELQLDELTLRIGWNPERGLHLDRVVLEGGVLELSEALAVDMEKVGEGDQTTLDFLANSPEVVVRDLRVRVVPPQSSTIALGSVDLCMTRLTDELASIYGRLVPALGSTPGGAGVVWLNGTLDANRVARVRGVARSLELGSALQRRALSNGLLPPELLALDPSAKIDLVAHASYEIGRSLLPDVNGTLQLSQGALELPWIEDPSKRTATDIALLVDGRFNPEDPDHPFDPEAWQGRGVLEGRIGGVKAAAGFRLGKDAPLGSSLEVWADVPAAPLGEELMVLIGNEQSLSDVHEMLASQGQADISTRGATPDRRRPRRRAGRQPREVSPSSAQPAAQPSHTTGSSIRGPGGREPDFPFRWKGSWATSPGACATEGEFRGQLAFYDVTCFQAGGPLEVQGSLPLHPHSAG